MEMIINAKCCIKNFYRVNSNRLMNEIYTVNHKYYEKLYIQSKKCIE